MIHRKQIIITVVVLVHVHTIMFTAILYNISSQYMFQVLKVNSFCF